MQPRWQCRIVNQMAVVALLAVILAWFYQLLVLLVIFAGPLLLALSHRAKGGSVIAGGIAGAVLSYCTIGIVLALLDPRIRDHLFLVFILLTLLGVLIGSSVGAWLWTVAFLLGKDLRGEPPVPAVRADEPIVPIIQELAK